MGTTITQNSTDDAELRTRALTLALGHAMTFELTAITVARAEAYLNFLQAVPVPPVVNPGKRRRGR